MRNVFKIFDRLTLKYMKQRTLIIYLAIQNISLSLIVLVATNVILSRALSFGQLNYTHIKLFYTSCIALLFVISYIMTPIFLSKSINTLYNNNIVDNLLASRVTPYDIVNAAFLRGFTFVCIMLVTAIPIISISFYFGGVSINTILKVFLMIFLYTLMISSACTYISASVRDANIAMVISYVVCFVALVITVFVLNFIVWNVIYITIYAVTALTLTLMFLLGAKNTTIFSI